MQGASVFVAAMTMNDLPVVVSIERESFPDPWTGQMFVQEMTSGFSRFYVARLTRDNGGHTVVGYGGMRWDSAWAEIMNIAVRKDFRKQHIGSFLMRYLMDVVRSCHVERVYLEVRQDNETAISMYEKFGFEKFRIWKNYYRTGSSDAIEMVLNLQGSRGVMKL